MEIISLTYDDGEVIPVEFTRKNMCHIRLRALPGGRILLSAPRLSPRAKVDDFLTQNKDWIRKHHAKRTQNLGYVEMPFLFKDGTAYYLGVRRRVSVLVSREDRVDVTPDEIVIRCKRSLDRAEKVYVKYLSEEAMELFTRAMERWMPLFATRGVRPPTIKVRCYRSKWGTCFPTKGEIVMNLHLIKADPAYTDYVMLHEMTHLLYFGHGKKFYSFLLRAMPDARERRRRLNEGVRL